MRALRALLIEHPRVAILALLAALCMKAMLPAGYMLDTGAKTLAVTLCSDGSGGTKTVEITIPAKGGHDLDDAQANGKCAFSSLSMAATGGADGVLLALALAFILLLGFAPARTLLLGQVRYFQPPLRGPPATA